MKIKCATLFDITRTNVSTRRLDQGQADSTMLRRRGQQSNFETILQIIGMRSQPEDITDPEKTMTTLSKSTVWGHKYQVKIKIPVWEFEFTVSQQAVFSDGDNEFGKLLQDCADIPMITNLEEWSKLQRVLSVTDEYRNIYFEICNEQ